MTFVKRNVFSSLIGDLPMPKKLAIKLLAKPIFEVGRWGLGKKVGGSAVVLDGEAEVPASVPITMDFEWRGAVVEEDRVENGDVVVVFGGRAVEGGLNRELGGGPRAD
ncbi:hypothetical protein Scep_007188 [Stephania cephalantha]|uniref:Uncharacterized protein n=1 Tax=Stephania cephalantha TaxID=152367 RepID=A0AAP0K9C7_9MAGN